ncbi:MAG: formylglycine-generating enzyme family protein [Geminicoccaceae bacterium]
MAKNIEHWPDRKGQCLRDSKRCDWVDIPQQTFNMGAPPGEGYPEDGEGPQRQVALSSFRIWRTPVTNRQFGRFVRETAYRTLAETEGWSYVFFGLLSPEARRTVCSAPPETPWWFPVDGAFWRMPEGPGSEIEKRLDHPVVHVCWHDAVAFAHWAGGQLPTEAQWECAARGGRSGLKFPWGNELEPDGQHMANVWQGRFPGQNTALDGFAGTSPVRAFPENNFGLFDMIGNVWEWCSDDFLTDYHNVTSSENPVGQNGDGRKSLRGGSFLCHASYCARYRSAARSANDAHATSSNIGFRLTSTPS